MKAQGVQGYLGWLGMRSLAAPARDLAGLQRLLPPLLLLFLLLLLGACATPAPAVPASYVTLMASPDGSVGKVLLTGPRGTWLIEQARYAAPLDGSAAPAPVDEARFQHDFAEALAAQPLLPETFVLYFDSGVQLSAASRAKVPAILASAARRASADMTLVGHTDTVGEGDHNEILSLQRAQWTAAWLKAQGLKVDSVTLHAQGERQLRVPTPDAQREPRNRRVEITIR